MKKNSAPLRIILLISFQILFCFSCNQSTKEDKINELISYCSENDIFNGSVLVAEGGNILFKNAYGYSNLEDKKVLNLNTPSCIGSVSKQFTAMAVMILKEQNKLNYEDKLVQYFPGIPCAKKITIRHLLNHTSGTLRYTDLPELRINGLLKDDLTNQDVFDALVKRNSLDFEPGEKYSYTNSGFILLAMIIEKIAGEPFHKFLKDYIFSPLEMNNTFVCDGIVRYNREKAIGYNIYGDRDDYNVLVEGAGGIYSTVEDLYKWDQALYSEKLVSQKTLKEAFTPGLLNNGNSSRTISDSTWGYGFGWLLRKTNTADIVWHDGGFNGFSAIIYRELNNRDCIILISNMGQMGANAPVYPIHHILLNILDGKPYELPRIPIAIKVRKTIENNGIGSAIKEYYQLKKNKPDKYDFSENQLNNLGYYHLNNDNRNEAIALFRINVEQFPASSNAYDSFGEAYMKNGQKELAIKNYEKSLELNPANENAQEMLKRLK